MKSEKKIKRNSVGLYSRRMGALDRLVAQRKAFIKAGVDKLRKDGTTRLFKAEVARMDKEIESLNKILNQPVTGAPKSKK